MSTRQVPVLSWAISALWMWLVSSRVTKVHDLFITLYININKVYTETFDMVSSALCSMKVCYKTWMRLHQGTTLMSSVTTVASSPLIFFFLLKVIWPTSEPCYLTAKPQSVNFSVLRTLPWWKTYRQYKALTLVTSSDTQKISFSFIILTIICIRRRIKHNSQTNTYLISVLQ